MKISTGPLLKGVGGATAATAATTAAVYGENIYSFFATGSFQIVDETEKIASLKLPEENCKWPDRYSQEPAVCELDSDKLKKINFNGKDTSGLTVTGNENFTLTIERLWGDKIFDKGYRFILKNKEENNTATITINSNLSLQLKKDMNFEFKIKEEGKKWYLERAWDEKTIKERIGLECSSNGNECSLKRGGKINIIAGSKKVEGISGLSGLSGGKIKLHKNSKDYHQSLKFSIEDGDVNLSGGGSTPAIKKLERDETYEIKNEGDKWYLSRRVSTADVINEKISGLNLPNDCKWPVDHPSDAVTCTLDKGKLENINFDGKESYNLTATGANSITLKIEKDEDTKVFPNRVKITFENTENVTIKKSGGDSLVEWKKGTNPEYKINGSGAAKTLKKAWEKASDLADKAKIRGCDINSKNECSIIGQINVRDGNKTSLRRNVSSENSKVLKYEENQPGYNQGFKFTPKDKITLSSGGSISELEVGSFYEVKLFGGEWFLSRVTPTPAGK